MKISKKRLLEIIQEECGMPMKSYEMNPKGEIDREGRMAKRQLADIAVKHYVEYGMEEGAYDQVTAVMEPKMPEMDQMAGEIGEFPLEKPMMESKDDDIYEF